MIIINHFTSKTFKEFKAFKKINTSGYDHYKPFHFKTF